MTEEKKCPQRFHPDGDGECIKEKCEWWSQIENCCSIGLIGNALAGISRATK